MNDAYGTPISQIPMMKDLTTADIDIFGFSCGVSADPWMRQWGPLHKPILMSGGSSLIAQAMPYYQAEVLTAYLNGARGLAELEQIYGKFTIATALMDATNLASLYGICLILYSNIRYQMDRRKTQ